MYKLIAIDLDGTLLTDKKNISRENLEFLNYLATTGYEIVIATGRSYYSARLLTKDFIKPMAYIANNGNIIRHSEDNRDISSRILDADDFKIIIEEGKLRRLYPIVHVDHYHRGYDIILSSDSIKNLSLGDYTKTNDRFRQVNSYLNGDIDRVLAIVYPGKHRELKEFNLYVHDMFPEKFSTHVMENIEIAEALFEVMNPMGNKWNSIKEYADSKGIKREEIIGIGDDNNDIEMIRNVGLGIAMKNGSSLIKSVADLVTEKDNNESGVSFELKRVLGF